VGAGWTGAAAVRWQHTSRKIQRNAEPLPPPPTSRAMYTYTSEQTQRVRDGIQCAALLM
jgi:hypothetical protein